MINQKASVLNAITNNGGDVAIVDGAVNITGLDPIPLTGFVPNGVQRIAAQAEQIQKTRLTFTSENSADYQFIINGYSIQYGTPKQAVISWTSSASNSTTLTSAAITALVNAVGDFTVSATDTAAGVVDLAGTAGFLVMGGSQIVGPVFSVSESDTKITVSAPLTVTFSAAPAGGRTATGYVVVPNDGTLTTGIAGSVKIIDGGEGYLAAPTFTFAGGEKGAGASAAATAYISEGKVVGVNTTAGATYNTRIGIVEVGTPRAIKAKYGYLASSLNNPSSPFLKGLSALVDGYTYSEWVFQYTEPIQGGVGVNSSTTATIQQSLFVYQSYAVTSTTGAASNLDTLDSYWGVLANLQNGYKASIVDSGADNVVDAVTVATGVITLVAGGTPANGAVTLGMKSGDTIVVGTGLIVNTAASGVFPVALFTTNLLGFVQFGTTTYTATDLATNTVYKLVKKSPLPIA
jgi:hypothetical protein